MHEINVLHLHSVQRRLAREPAFVEAQARVQEVVVIVIVFYCIKVSSTRSIVYLLYFRVYAYYIHTFMYLYVLYAYCTGTCTRVPGTVHECTVPGY